MARFILIEKSIQTRVVKKVCPRCSKYFDVRELNRHKSHCPVPTEPKVTMDDGKNPHLFQRDLNLRNKYGITFEIYRQMYLDQNGKCAICGQAKPLRIDTPLPFAVDHCHKTNIVRGLLCRLCNVGLGVYKDDPARLKNAYRYLTGDLTDHHWKPTPINKKQRRRLSRGRPKYVPYRQIVEEDENHERFLNAISE